MQMIRMYRAIGIEILPEYCISSDWSEGDGRSIRLVTIYKLAPLLVRWGLQTWEVRPASNAICLQGDEKGGILVARSGDRVSSSGEES
jgi:hypothetical protein